MVEPITTRRDIPEAELLRELERIGVLVGAGMRSDFIQSVHELVAGIDSVVLEAAIETGSVERVVASVPWIRFRLRLEQIGGRMVVAFDRGAQLGIRLLPGAPSAIPDLDALRIYASEWARARAAQLVTIVDNATRAGLRAIVAESFREPRSVAQTARIIRSSIGLDRRQSIAFDRFLREVLADTDLSSARIQQLLDRKYAKLLRYRATTIARTEAYAAAAAGQRRAWLQSVSDGLLPQSDYVREWVARAAGRCPICDRLDERTAEIDGSFWDSATGWISGPTAHPRCYCSTRLRRRDDVPVELLPMAA